MKIRAVSLRIQTLSGEYGYFVEFARNLTVIRGNNSSGKSTLFNSLLYGLGMEELIGGKGEKFLPYAVKEDFETPNGTIRVQSSAVFLEIENSQGKVVTLQRAIVDALKSTKLVEIFDGPRLTEGTVDGVSVPTYLFDPGAAVRDEGFHHFLTNFLGLSLPKVGTSSGGEAKLYLQTIFAALAVEQKRGWSDYITNIPFYAIRDARTRVVEFILNLSVFETTSKKNKLDIESIEIANDWNKTHAELMRVLAMGSTVAYGIPPTVSAQFDSDGVTLKKIAAGQQLPLEEYMPLLRREYSTLDERTQDLQNTTGTEAREKLERVMQELQNFTHIFDTVTSKQNLQKAALNDYRNLLNEEREDLARNKAALKLRTLGANHGMAIAEDVCPTCSQTLADTLLAGIVSGPQMDLEANIAYLERQCKMLANQIAGLEFEGLQHEASLSELGVRIDKKREELNSVRTDFASGATQSRANVKRQMQIEDEVSLLEKVEDTLRKSLVSFTAISARLANNQTQRKLLPNDIYSSADKEKIDIFEKYFRANAGTVSYESADIQKIRINHESLTPFLENLELRVLADKARLRDIKVDSSASDFVRLIWSYLLALFQASSHGKGNHPGILLLDEPGQHSMAVTSQRALLLLLSAEANLQSIVAASFDQSEPVFQQATENIQFKLIEWDRKSIRKLDANHR